MRTNRRAKKICSTVHAIKPGKYPLKVEIIYFIMSL
jgi:hypothetical protein